nr:hypothetical protein [uncultured Rhodopila sp.]
MTQQQLVDQICRHKVVRTPARDVYERIVAGTVTSLLRDYLSEATARERRRVGAFIRADLADYRKVRAGCAARLAKRVEAATQEARCTQ